MSTYLIKELAAVENVTVRGRTVVRRAEGTTHLEALVLRDGNTGADTYVPADGLAVLIGQQPATQWAEGLLQRDGEGFLLTGSDLLRAPDRGDSHGRRGRRDRRSQREQWWPLPRDPLFLETSVPGVFVAGDVRYGSTKRVGSAVGEGAIAVRLVHRYLGEFAAADTQALAGAGVPPLRAARSPLVHPGA
jgi:thioredoxin reductase (NADPH)